MKRLLRNLFIKKSIFWQNVLSILLELPILYFLFKDLPTRIEDWGVVLVYIIITSVYYITSFKDAKEEFVSVSYQISQDYSPNVLTYLWVTIVSFIKYIFQLLLLQSFIPSEFANLQMLNNFLVVTIICFILSRIFYTMIKLPFIIVCVYIIIPLFLVSLFGIDKSFLEWTFISLILSSVLSQFASMDIKYLLPKGRLRNIIESNQDKDKIREALVLLKYRILLFVPFLYLSLLFFENIIYTDKFNYLFNLFFDTHIDLLEIGYLTVPNLLLTFIKALIILFGVVVFMEYKDIIIVRTSYLLFKKITGISKEYEFDGKHVKVNYKNGWNFDKSDFYCCYKQNLISSTGTKSGLAEWHYENNLLVSDFGSPKRIKIVSDDVFVIEGDYYVKYTPENIKALSNKITANKLLNKPDHIVLVFPLLLLILSWSASYYVDLKLYENFRGNYSAVTKLDSKLYKRNEDKILNFGKDEINYNGKKYKIDNIKMSIIDSDGEKIGYFNKNGILILKNENEEMEYFILKKTQLYERLPLFDSTVEKDTP